MMNIRKVYSAVMKTPLTTQMYAYVEPTRCEAPTASISASLEKNPELPGNPISARHPTKQVQYVMGMYLRSPPHLAHVLLVMHGDDHRARCQEQQRLEEGVGHEVKNTRAVGRHAQRPPSCNRAATKSSTPPPA